MKRRRNLLLVLICTLIIMNTTVIYVAAMQSLDVISDDYQGNIQGYASSMIVESGWCMHRGRSYVSLMGSDKVLLNKVYKADSSIGTLCCLGRLGNWNSAVVTHDECTKHGYFSSVKTTLETENSEISITAKD